MKYNVSVIGNEIYVNGKKAKKLDSGEDFGSGGYRLTKQTEDGYIVKADYQDAEEELDFQTRAEIQLWSKISIRDRRHFPKIIAHGTYGKKKASWLIEEKISIDRDHIILKKEIAIIERLQEKYEIYDLDWGSSKEEYNWGVTFRGRIVIWDFGVNKFNFGSELATANS